ncbi:MAG: hypothetical protein DRI34_09855 [Deltaproteobacteria bacterium]|nr:MAG: hypothetical protein DRI34_09855 [Deltaproteobacteria bacterium]HDY83064.1 hypothetical protein [Halieaceae bacterium]
MKGKIAVIGGGVAGLTAAHLLCRQYQVQLFEKTDRIGGNAYTYRTRDGEEVDIAVAAFGKAGYPTFYKLLKHLGIKTRLCLSSYMSFHDLDRGTGIYLTPGLRGLAAQRFRLLKPSLLRQIRRLFRGVKKSYRLLDQGAFTDQTLAQALERIPELSDEARIIFICSLCLLSSMSASEVLDSPAEFFFHKLKVHHDVISPKAVYSVRAVANKTRSYIDALAAPFRDNIVLSADIRTVERSPQQVSLLFADGSRASFDKVIFACHADQALALLARPNAEEQRLLGPWRYKDGRMLLHADHSSFPRRALMQAYTFLYTDRQGRFDTSVNGALWHEPGVSRRCRLISSQHPNFEVAPELVEFETVLRTPIFDFASVPTIEQLPTLNGNLNSYYCGSYFGHGLHEDAVSSAVAVARQLGVEL